mgnify:CR=1 FL=1
MFKFITTLLLVSVIWAPPMIAVTLNRLNPGLGTGLGVPYGILTGIVAGLILSLIIVIASRKWPLIRPYYPLVILALVHNMALFPFANQGVLSVVN